MSQTPDYTQSRPRQPVRRPGLALPQARRVMDFPSVEVFLHGELVYWGPLDEPVELGRQSEQDGGQIFHLLKGSSGARVAVAPRDHTDLSRRFALLAPTSDGLIELTNLSNVNVLEIDDRRPLGPSESRRLPLPLKFKVLDVRVAVSGKEDRSIGLRSLGGAMLPPGTETMDIEFDLVMKSALATADSSDAEQLYDWLVGVAKVLQAASGSADFHGVTARQMVDLIGLDRGMVLMLEEGRWSPAACYERSGSTPETHPRLNLRLLAEVALKSRTVWESREAESLTTESQPAVAVASPILSSQGVVVGALYGERARPGPAGVVQISKMEAMLVEAMAGGVAAGRARLEHEREAAQARVRFEQFFTTELSHRLAASPDMLTCRDTDVTLLFCDIRYFSRITEALGPELTMEWLRQVMGELADCAAAHDGVLVDFIGDELMIMWGAPDQQADHAQRACLAALDMSRQVLKLDERWREVIGQSTELGFGVNTGVARVGNVGLDRKFRYAPFGASVNLASRLQSATKHFGVDILVSESTKQAASPDLVTRRLASIRVMNIVQPVVVYELRTDTSPTSRDLCFRYEQALTAFEQGSFAESLKILSAILGSDSHDGPTLLLLSRVVEVLRGADAPFDPVFELPTK